MWSHRQSFYSLKKEYFKKNYDKVPSAVQNLLTSIQRLLEVLQFWSVEEASEGDVSDMYMKFGNELNLTVSVFAEHQIDLRYVYAGARKAKKNLLWHLHLFFFCKLKWSLFVVPVGGV